MFEITGNEISELNDTDLRTLVGLLCEADLRVNCLSTAGVTWGGHQDAKDGGLDVRVELSSTPDPDGFVPRSVTGYQVKKPDMPRAEIIKEMRPGGKLRQVIQELAAACGAYIIVSSTGSTSDSALRDRRDAMKEAVADIDHPSSLTLDFYDRGRLAGWVRSHPSLVLWVRGKIGRPMQGWRPFENWANAPGGIEEEYLLDEEVRLHDGTTPVTDGMAAVNGINHLRSVLHRPASSVRLAGLSGVGKTRLLQALFDDRIGQNSLNPTLVLYTDVSDSPDPDPRVFAERLIALQRPAILAVDNCPPDLHRRLTSVCVASGSSVSLITVEYDVREDQPEGTDIFLLEPASIALVEKMIQIRFKHVSQTDARTIAEFSGGNARIAIALANTVIKGETLADLKDDDLFQRLFVQRNESSHNLLRSAEVCSLVYSFDCQAAKDLDSELKLLAKLVGRSVSELFRDVSELKRRDLVQQRNVWRAVLPHALANKLAQRALENIPLDEILAAFVEEGAERLLKSFSRRLSYLHKSEIAVEVAGRWLSADGLLGNVSDLNELGISLLGNIAPIAPLATLEVIERAANSDNGQDFTSRQNIHFSLFTNLLRSLAYDAALFDRCTGLIIRFALSEKPNENNNSIRDLLKSLFYIHLSGTHASASHRLKVIERLIDSASENEQELGLLLLRAALETSHFSSHHVFDFGARPRDYGYWPKTRAEIIQWYTLFIRLTEGLALSQWPLAVKAKKILANNFRGLWCAGVFDELERVTKVFLDTDGVWNDGWIAVRTTIRYDAKRMDSELIERLQVLEKILAPASLLERARTFAFSCHGSALDLVDALEGDDGEVIERYERVDEVSRQIGREVARNEDVFKVLLPEIVRTGGPRLHSFSQGLAEGTVEPLAMWQAFRQHLASTPTDQRNCQALCGFLYIIAKSQPELSEIMLNDAVKDDVLGALFPILQTSVRIDENGVKRLNQSLAIGFSPIDTFRNLANGRSHESINDINLSDLLSMIASKPGGLDTAIDILYMRLHSHKDTGCAPSEAILSVGQQLLLQLTFNREDKSRDRMDHELSGIVNVCFKSKAALLSAKNLSNKMAKAISEYLIYPNDYRQLLASLALKQPIAFLDGFFLDSEDPDFQLLTGFGDDFDREPSPLSQIDDGIILDWCEMNPPVRYPIIAASICAYRHNECVNQLEWEPQALSIVDNSPDVIAVLNIIKRKFRPSSWSGSRADIMEKRLILFAQLKTHQNPLVVEWACDEEVIFEEEISSERKWEQERSRSRDERFE
ncbi:MAG: hypothetical protein WCK54_17435 [Desulfuromonadales bacterium]